ncbi:MAG: hypothetical protein AB7M93_30555 [Candidatus Obscuribacterales bacterium]
MKIEVANSATYNKREYSTYEEACWAAFFDHRLIDWKVTYEPKDPKEQKERLNFTGWCPQFLIHKKNRPHTTCIAQVIRGNEFPEELGSVVTESLSGQADYEPLLIAESPFPVSNNRVCFGWYGHFFCGVDELNELVYELHWSRAIFGRWTIVGGKIGFATEHDPCYDYMRDFQDDRPAAMGEPQERYELGGAKLLVEEINEIWSSSKMRVK